MQRPSKDEIGELFQPASSDVALSKEVLITTLCEQGIATKDILLSAVLGSQELDARIPLDMRAMSEKTLEEQVAIMRWVAAGRLGLAELQGAALALPMAALVTEGNLSVYVSIRTGPNATTSSSERFEEYSVALAQQYRVAPQALLFEGSGFILHDPDLYLRRIDADAMHGRVSTTLRQAVGCYRSSLFVGTAVLVGSASEGAWIELAQVTSERLQSAAPKLKQALARDISQLADIQKLTDSAIRSNCADELKRAGLNKASWQTAVDTGAAYRRYRNYAIHFGEDDFEVLDYATVGLLLLNATAYFNGLYRLRAALAD